MKVKTFGTIVLICTFGVVMLAVTAGAAEPSTNSAPAAVASAAGTTAHAETANQSIVSESALTLFHVGPLPVTNSMICTWIAAGVIFLIVRLTTWRIKEVPTAGQNVMEALVEGWESLMGNVLEPKVTRWVFPLATTYFIFIIISNFMDLLPGVGSIGLGHPDTTSPLPFAVQHVETPFFRPPTTDANLTVAMAAIFFVMCLVWAVQYNGFFGLIKHVFGVKVATNAWAYVPMLVLFIFIGIMESFSILFIRPVALALRLYGNIYGGETMLTMAMTQKSIIWAVLLALPGYFFECVVCTLQAFVFAMLTVAFVGQLCTHVEEAPGH